MHISDCNTGMWSSPVTTGDRPPPCSGFTFTAIDVRRAVVFGGFNLEMRRMDTVYIIDLITMVIMLKSFNIYIQTLMSSLQTWGNLNRSEGGSWPEERSSHAACCLNYGQQYPQLLVTGGLNRDKQPLADAWIFDIEKGRWRKVRMIDEI